MEKTVAAEKETIDVQVVAARYAAGERSFEGLMILNRGAALFDLQALEAHFVRCKFANATIRLEADGATFRSCQFVDCTLAHSALRNASFFDCTFYGSSLANAQFEHSRFADVRFDGCTLDAAAFGDASLMKTIFVGGTLKQTVFSGSSLGALRFENCALDETKIFGATDIKLVKVSSMQRAMIHHCRIRGGLTGVNLEGSEFRDTVLDLVDLTGTDLRETRLQSCSLLGAKLLAVRVNAETKFASCEVAKAIIERHTLELLRDYGGLTKGQRMTMDIKDGALLLRLSYTGFWQWLHAFALVLFLGPYLLQIAKDGLASSTTCPSGAACNSILARLEEAIYTGGAMDGEVSLGALAMFTFMLVYNVIRAVLLYKAKSLELQEMASGVPVVFPWQGRWSHLYAVAKYGFFVNVAIAVVHMLIFMHRSVVTTP